MALQKREWNCVTKILQLTIRKYNQWVTRHTKIIQREEKLILKSNQRLPITSLLLRLLLSWRLWLDCGFTMYRLENYTSPSLEMTITKMWWHLEWKCNWYFQPWEWRMGSSWLLTVTFGSVTFWFDRAVIRGRLLREWEEAPPSQTSLLYTFNALVVTYLPWLGEFASLLVALGRYVAGRYIVGGSVHAAPFAGFFSWYTSCPNYVPGVLVR